MDKNFYKIVTDIVEKTLDEKNYKLNQDSDLEYYSNGERAFMIDYEESQKLLALKVALLKEGQGVDFKTVSSWYLDENSDEKDMTSIGNDFSDTVLEQLGIKATAQGINKVELPSKDKNAETVTMENFTARFLSIYPTCKDAYKENVSLYGEFMYDKFYCEYGVKMFREVISGGNKKQITKLLELLSECFVAGDKQTSNAIVFCISAPAVLDDEKLRKDAYTYMEKYTYLLQYTEAMVNFLSSKKNREKYLAK